MKNLLAGKRKDVKGLYVKEALTVDLEGDGQPETIITTTNIRDEDIEAIASGKIDEGLNLIVQ